MVQGIRVFDMFCGGGGSSRGAHMAGAEIVAAVDMWKMAADTYRNNFPEATVYDVNTSILTPQQVIDDVGDIDLLLASPECTSHSPAKGNRSPCEESRATAFEVTRFAKVMKPRWIVVENVIQMQHWDRFEEWRESLEALGYKIKVRDFDAQYHSVPQSRRRLFIIGDLECEPSLPKRKQRTRKTVKNSILGKGESPTNPWRFSPVNRPTRARATIERVGRAIETLGDDVPFIMVYYGNDGAGGFQTLDRPLRTVTTLDRFAYVRPNGNGHEMRMLQPIRELAAAMGFPGNHWFPQTSRRNRIRLIGNAVCPRVMRDVVRSLTDKVN